MKVNVERNYVSSETGFILEVSDYGDKGCVTVGDKMLVLSPLEQSFGFFIKRSLIKREVNPRMTRAEFKELKIKYEEKNVKR